MFCQTVPITLFVTNGTRRLAFLANHQLLGKSPVEAQKAADRVALSIGSAVAAATACVTLDPIGGGLSGTILALELGDAETRQRLPSSKEV